MALLSVKFKKQTTAAGGDTFAYDFKIDANTDIKVIVSDADGSSAVVQTLTTDYTVTGVGDSGGGNVVFETASIPASGKLVTLLLDPPGTQTTDYQEGDTFPAETHEAALDKLTREVHRLKEIAVRAIVLPESTPSTNNLIPDYAITSKQDKFLKLTASGLDVASVTATDIANPLTTKGDILIHDTTAPVRLGVGSNDQLLVPDSAVGAGLKWLTATSHPTISNHASRITTLEGAGPTINGSLEASVAANALTVALKTPGGSDPSAGTPVNIKFRHATLTNGQYVVRSVTGALSMTVSVGSTLGFANSQTSRIYVGLLDNAGTVELFVYHPLAKGSGANDWSLQAIPESLVYNTSAEGGAGAADSAQVLYSTTARSGVAIRLLGYVDIQTGATAGNWSNAPSVKVTLAEDSPRTGYVLQDRRTHSGAVASTAVAIPHDDTIPQNTEGAEAFTVAITPHAAPNLLRATTAVWLAGSVSAHVVVALFQDAIADALACTASLVAGANENEYLETEHVLQAGGTSAITFKTRYGGSAGTATFNGTSGARKYGGALSSYIDVQEIMV